MLNNAATSSLFLKINLGITILLSLLFLQFNANYNIQTLFTIAALISTAATVYLIYYILFRLFFRFHATIYFLLLIFLLTDFLLMVDFAIYRVWGFHINAMVVNIIFSPAAYASLSMNTSSIFLIIFLISAFILFEFYIIKFLHKHNGNIPQINRKLNFILIPLLLVIIVTEKFTYAYASFELNYPILTRTKIIPLYQPLTMNTLFVRTFHFKRPRKDSLSIEMKKISTVNYPLHKLIIHNQHKPNIFIFGIDALRRDVISKETAPNIYAFMQDSIDYKHNISGGRATRFGIFSIFYGLYGNYWFSFLDSNTAPVFFDVLKDLKYNISIISSANLDWPEFKETVFTHVRKDIKDNFQGSILKKDSQTIAYAKKWLQQEKYNQPLFSFIWLDGVHARMYEKEHRVFLPDSFKGDYLTITKEEQKKVYNQYKNSVHAADAKFKQYIDTLKRLHLYKNSIIIVLSDHGEEFYEYGSFGHNSSFDKEQVNSTLIVHFPDKKMQSVTHMTSSLDIVPTILTYLGVQNPIYDYAQGLNLFSNKYKRDCSFVGSWNYNAIVCNKYTIVLSNISFSNEIRDTKSYKILKTYDKNYINNVMLKTINEDSRFMKKKN
jgi:membrane-anchored protein YejM (alkaline phosphatase superfamily)